MMQTNKQFSMSLRDRWNHLPRLVLFTVAMCLCQGGVPGVAAQSGTPHTFSADAYTKQIAPLLAQYCGACHGKKTQEADIAFHKYPNVDSVRQDADTWASVKEMLDFGAMPPEDQKQPTSKERSLLSDWIEAALRSKPRNVRDPGRVTIRRLNRVEYDNTVRDLTGLDLRLSENFPSDDVGEGFDNIGDVLSLPPLLFEKCMDAAEQIATTAIRERPEDLPESHRRIVLAAPGSGKTPEQAAREILTPFTSRAFRRPARPEEVEPLVRLVNLSMEKGDSFERGIQVAISAILVSPHFLFRVETDPEPDEPTKIRPLSDYELASRLSYFLWSSMPDEELLSLAERGVLHEEKVLEAQVQRMLQNSKAQSLVESFGGQWLNLRNLDEIIPDPAKFGPFDDVLRRDMVRETEMFFATVMREDRSILEFLTGDFTFINERLARHYGMNGVRGETLRKITLPDGKRIGLLTHASILTLTSNPTRTSPVKRGKWIMENVLGTPPPDPPPNVPALEETQRAEPDLSLREQMILHRDNPVCASCHRQMDQLGFGLENFDATGRWREKDGKFPVEASGELPSGEKFSGPAELVQILAKRKHQFTETLVSKMLIYALGRGIRPYDQHAINWIVRRVEDGDYRLSAVITGIVMSRPFRMRRGDGGAE